jgi:hypothetical protein
MIAGKVELLPGATHDIEYYLRIRRPRVETGTLSGLGKRFANVEVEFPRTWSCPGASCHRGHEDVSLCRLILLRSNKAIWVYQDNANAIHINRNGEFYWLGRFVSPNGLTSSENSATYRRSGGLLIYRLIGNVSNNDQCFLVILGSSHRSPHRIELTSIDLESRLRKTSTSPLKQCVALTRFRQHSFTGFHIRHWQPAITIRIKRVRKRKYCRYLCS